MLIGFTRMAIIAVFTMAALLVGRDPASALGTVRIQKSDGSVKTYTNVRIAIRDKSMSLTSSDGKGTLVIGKAACTKIGVLVRCLPYEATLQQFGRSATIGLKSGTAWLNPEDSPQQLSYSSTQLPPHGVMLAVQTERGTYVTLTGTVDSIKR